MPSFLVATTTISYAPRDTNIRVNGTNILPCMASYDPQMDVTYVWYMGDMLVEFERIDRLGENRFEVWWNPHFKRVGLFYVCLFPFLHIQAVLFFLLNEGTCLPWRQVPISPRLSWESGTQ